MEALRLLFAVGLKVTEIVQAAFTARLVPQLLVCAKSGALVPLTAMELMVSSAVPLLVSEMVFAAEAVPTVVEEKLSEVGLRVTFGAVAAVAVPVRETVWGEPEALSAMLSDPVRAPDAVGLKVTAMEQLAAAARLVPQVLVWL